jgi:CCR4-NOT transcription complex subunit 6
MLIIFFAGRFFPSCKPEHLRWADRRTALIETITALDADLLCLQEVEHFEGFWRPALRALGYRGVYKQRGGGAKADGCATFFREDRFELITHRGLDFDRLCRRGPDRGGPPFPTHNAALLTLLAPARRTADPRASAAPPPPPWLVVANVHLFWDPGYEDLKLAQARAAVAAAEALALEAIGSGSDAGGVGFGGGGGGGGSGCSGRPAAILLAGDFNAMPESVAYEHLTGPARFTSAYASVAAAEPSFTNFRDSFRGAIDYFFIRDAASAGPRLRAAAVLGMIGPEAAAAEGGGLPASRHPSDHLPLAVDLVLLPGRTAADRLRSPPTCNLAPAVLEQVTAVAVAAAGRQPSPPDDGAIRPLPHPRGGGGCSS